MSKYQKHDLLKFVEKIILLILSLFRIWIAHIQNIDVVIKGGGSDDWHQVKQVVHLVSGNWLGEYNAETYIKEIGYPLFCAVLNKLHISYGMGCGLLVVFVSGLCALALAPIMQPKYVRIAYLYILYNPIGFKTLKLYRESMLGWVPIGVIACVLGVYLYGRSKKYKQMMVFGVAGFFFSAWFQILKEDAIWMLPFVLCAGAVCIIRELVVGLKSKAEVKPLILVTFAVSMFFSGSGFSDFAVSKINEKYYGVALTNDRSKGEMARLCGALYQIDADDVDEDRNIWITRCALNKAIEESEHLAGLDGLVEAFEEWGNGSAGLYQGWPRGDMCTWAIRTALKRNGYYDDEQKAQDFCKAVADELEAAFAEGRLTKRKQIYLTGYIRGFTVKELTDSALLSVETIGLFSAYKNARVSMDVFYPNGSLGNIFLAEDMFKIKMPLTDEQIVKVGDKGQMFSKSNQILIKERELFIFIVAAFYKIYRLAMWIIIPASIISLMLMIAKFLKGNRETGSALLIVIALILTAFSATYVTALFSSWMSNEPGGGVFTAYCPVIYFLMDLVKIILCGFLFGELCLKEK
ncbi:MAG: hypothetical protein K6E70_07360 [Butyrivibrio sp.]|nr:hypothetical protein [Butyrivibrio sp.]